MAWMFNLQRGCSETALALAGAQEIGNRRNAKIPQTSSPTCTWRSILYCSATPQPARSLGKGLLPVPLQEPADKLMAQASPLGLGVLKEKAKVLHDEWAAAAASGNGAPSKRPTNGRPRWMPESERGDAERSPTFQPSSRLGKSRQRPALVVPSRTNKPQVAQTHSTTQPSNSLAIRVQICTIQDWSGAHHSPQTPGFNTIAHHSLCGPCSFSSSRSLTQAQGGCGEKHKLGQWEMRKPRMLKPCSSCEYCRSREKKLESAGCGSSSELGNRSRR
ncbi:hypothetical protein FIBSPDRAFT_892786 [Athelia psychrophila]|uniref:Uncharacterized protein n=1 Tax=Athelia psychrophila TaxID=1759441 RepID=A0A166HZJ3_9AGAM|nr:hypothetical protein FIBSPDRAFT_892786 [Fibularhizoctonia sp. CBS 109695]